MSSSARIRIVSGAFLLAAAGVLSSAPASAQAISVVVNGQPILTSEVQSRLGLLKLQSGGKGGSVAQAQEELIDERLKLAEAKRYGMTADQAQVDAAFNGIAQRTKLTPAQFSQAIQQRGVNPQTLKDRIGAEMAWGQLVRRKYANQITSDPAATGATAKPLSNRAIQYTVRQVVFVLPKGSTDAQAAQRRTEAVAARGRFPGCAGAVQFAAALRDVAVKEPVVRSSASIGKQLAEQLDKIKVGGMTEPQRSEDGFEMIAVCERKDINDDGAYRQQDDDASMKKLESRATAYLDQLKSRAIIERR